MQEAALLPERVRDTRLGLETAVIVRLANVLLALLQSRDPLSERVHLSGASAAMVAARAAAGALPRRVLRRILPSAPSRRDGQ
jgi:hypothetical protein